MEELSNTPLEEQSSVDPVTEQKEDTVEPIESATYADDEAQAPGILASFLFPTIGIIISIVNRKLKNSHKYVVATIVGYIVRLLFIAVMQS